MKSITFLSNQDNNTFPLNTSTKFNVLLNHRQQDTNRHHHAHNRPQSLTLATLLLDVKPKKEARLYTLACSLVRNRTLMNAQATNVYKIVCLAPHNHSGIGYTLNFNTVDPLPLHHNEDQIKFVLTSLYPLNKQQQLERTVYLNEFPTVVNLVACPPQSTLVSTTTDTMLQSESDQYKIVLNSTDRNSRAFVRNNTAVDFEGVLELPFNTANERWSMELSSIFIHRHVFSTFPLTVKPEHLKFRLVTLSKPPREDAQADYTDITWEHERTFNTGDQLLKLINNKMSEYTRLYAHARFTMVNNKVQWHYQTTSKLGPDDFEKFEDSHLRKQHLVYRHLIDVIALLPKAGLGKLLGFASPDDDTAGDCAFSLWNNAHRHNIENVDPENESYFNKKTVAPHLSFQYPIESTNNVDTPLVVTCNLVENSLLGGRHVRMLRLITVKNNTDKHPYIGYEEFTKSHPVNLETKTFSSIRIQLCNLNGDIIPVASNTLNNNSINTVVMLTLRKQTI